MPKNRAIQIENEYFSYEHGNTSVDEMGKITTTYSFDVGNRRNVNVLNVFSNSKFSGKPLEISVKGDESIQVKVKTMTFDHSTDMLNVTVEPNSSTAVGFKIQGFAGALQPPTKTRPIKA